MKRRTILSVLLAFFGILSVTAQKFSCQKLQEDIANWNKIKNEDNVKWANAIKENGYYNLNADGSLEYTYIVQSTDTLYVETIRQMTFDYIGLKYPNMNNSTRADMVTNSPKNGVIFIGKISNIGSYSGLYSATSINANVSYDIRFKPDRIRFSVKIQSYQIASFKTGTYDYQTEYVSDCYPLNEKSGHKKSFAMAFINATSSCVNSIFQYINYLNSRTTTKTTKVDDDW